MLFSVCKQFPEVTDGKIEVVPFLEASKEIVKFVEILGTVFSPVKNDISGNIEKLSKIHHSDEAKFSTLNGIVEHELPLERQHQIGIDALLWLKRALEYVNVFLSCFAEDGKQPPCSENMSAFFHKAYEEKLKPFHGWIVQKVFGLIVIAAPSRSSLLKLLSGGKDPVPEEEIIKDIEQFLIGLNSNIDTINRLYVTHNLHFNHKV
ncbi:hypothetical protein JTE90_027930 [Oedothorax gibbosus]|uniref:Glycolipid transfer protein domain-containing protein n=1 Tax=Oedothorax gibbosus TaxID=931172 RepID=A0AAV6VGK8_9ARAC|nr:hypothetical protein JTE90_027930 [Oedothorax gibbosus]